MPTTKKNTNLYKSLIMGVAHTIYESLEGAKKNWQSANEIAEQSEEKIEWLLEQLSKQIKLSKTAITEKIIHIYEPYYIKRRDWYLDQQYYQPQIWCAANWGEKQDIRDHKDYAQLSSMGNDYTVQSLLNNRADSFFVSSLSNYAANNSAMSLVD